MQDAEDGLVKLMQLRRADACVGCATPLAPGVQAQWDSATRTVRCLSCPESVPTAPAVQPSVGGGSARRAYERRRDNRAQRLREAHPRLGGLILALTDDPASTRVWAQGARGERAVAVKLDQLGDDVLVLHDRAMRRADGRLSTANIDHIAVTSNGVWVIDAKTHKGALQVCRSGGLFSPRTEELFIGGRNQNRLLDGLEKQVEAVVRELERVNADVTVRSALCFVGTELPWFGEHIRGVPLVGRRGLGKLLSRRGDFERPNREYVARYLADRFPPAN